VTCLEKLENKTKSSFSKLVESFLKLSITCRTLLEILKTGKIYKNCKI